MKRILTSGATGSVGYETLRFLQKINPPDVELLAGVRNVDRARESMSPIPCVPFDVTQPEQALESLSDIDSLFLMRPPQISDIKNTFEPLLAQIEHTPVRHIVFLSLQGVENNPIVPHYKIEQAILESGIPYTFLRPSFFMQNLSTTHREEIRDRDEIFVPAGSGNTNFIDVRDIAEVAVLSLLDSQHQNKAYTLTGARGYTYFEIAELLSGILERPIRYANPSALSFIFHKKRQNLPLKFILVMTALYTIARLGKADEKTDTLETLLQRPPRSLEAFLHEHRHLWIREEND